MAEINPVTFYLLAGIILLGALGVVTLKNLFHSALSLILCFLSIAGLYFNIHADFLAAAQVLIYVGAIAVIILFAIMLTRNIDSYASNLSSKLRITRGAGVLIFILCISVTLFKNPWSRKLKTDDLNIAELGHKLLTSYAFPFELLSLILLAALIGALILAKDDKNG